MTNEQLYEDMTEAEKKVAISFFRAFDKIGHQAMSEGLRPEQLIRCVDHIHDELTNTVLDTLENFIERMKQAVENGTIDKEQHCSPLAKFFPIKNTDSQN